MSLINYCVFCKSSKQTVVSWKITGVHLQHLSYREFFNSDVNSKYCVKRLCDAYAGRTKEKLDPVDMNLAILEVAPIF